MFVCVFRSGTSVVSVLSNLSAVSNTNSAHDNTNKGSSSFSIQGLEHSLLSRGKVTAAQDDDGGTTTGNEV